MKTSFLIPRVPATPFSGLFLGGKILTLSSSTSAPIEVKALYHNARFYMTFQTFFPTLLPELRSQYPLVSNNPPDGCLEAINEPRRTILGPVQKKTSLDTLSNSIAKYKFIINEVPIQQVYFRPYHRWEGYSAERQEILNFIKINKIKNVIFLT